MPPSLVIGLFGGPRAAADLPKLPSGGSDIPRRSLLETSHSSRDSPSSSQWELALVRVELSAARLVDIGPSASSAPKQGGESCGHAGYPCGRSRLCMFRTVCEPGALV
jgi:hypothetical protein